MFQINDTRLYINLYACIETNHYFDNLYAQRNVSMHIELFCV